MARDRTKTTREEEEEEEENLHWTECLLEGSRLTRSEKLNALSLLVPPWLLVCAFLLFVIGFANLLFAFYFSLSLQVLDGKRSDSRVQFTCCCRRVELEIPLAGGNETIQTADLWPFASQINQPKN